MKKLKISLIVSILFFSFLNLSPVETKAQVAVSFQVFYNDLAPYGTWVSYSNYGYAWAPGIGVGFRPYYSGGHWAYTDEGWLWISDYPWGWAPYHYGTWVMDPMYGWLWVPGYDWAPAWVSWGYYNGYYGWAPCEPGFSISVGYYPPINYWVFAQPRYMVSGELYRNGYPARNQRIAIGNNTITNVQRISPVGNTAQRGGRTYFAGPPRQDFERNSKTAVQPVSVRESAKPGRTELSGNAVNVYRPQVQKMEDARPVKVARVEDLPVGQAGLKPAQRAGGNAQQGSKTGIISGKNNDRVNGGVNKPSTAPAAPRQQQTKPQVQPSQGKKQPGNIQQPKEAPHQTPHNSGAVQQQREPKQIQREQQPQQPRSPEMNRQPNSPAQPQQPKQARQMQRQPRQQAPPREMSGPMAQPQAPPMQQQGPQEEHGRKK